MTEYLLQELKKILVSIRVTRFKKFKKIKNIFDFIYIISFYT